MDTEKVDSGGNNSTRTFKFSTILCCICYIPVRNERNIFQEYIGQPPILICDLIIKCLSGVVDKVDDTGGICRKCVEKLLRYYKAINIAREIRAELLDLTKGPLINLKNTRNVYAEITSENGRNDASTQHGSVPMKAETSIKTEISNEIEAIDVVRELVVNPPQSPTANESVVPPVTEDDIIEEYVDEYKDNDFSSCQLILNADDVIIEEREESNDEMLLEDIIESDDQEFTNADSSCELEATLYSGDSQNCSVNNYEGILLEQFDGILEDPSEYVNDPKKPQRRLMASRISIDERLKLKCEDCNLAFPSSRQYRSHVKKQHFAGYVCDECGKTLNSYSGFKIHIQNHNPVKQFACPTCGERYANKMTLKHHMAWHTGEKNFECDICAKKFVHRVNLYKHRQIHDSSTRKLECEICGFKFRNKPHLTRHMMTHTKQKPHSCPHCGHCFAQLYNLRTHIREHENPGSTRQARMRCKKCRKCFTSKKNFTEHCERDDCQSKTEDTSASAKEV